MRLANEVAVITGASSGIGRAAARAIAAEGAAVVVVGRRRARVEDLAGELESAGREALAVTADVTREDEVDRLHEAALARFGRVDILVNNAGVGKYGPFDSLTAEDYDWMMDTNMRSGFLCTRAFLPAMVERAHGQVCFLGSVAGLKGLPGETVYCATKFAQMGYAQALDYETRDRGVKVSVVAPGGVSTEFAMGTGRTADDPALEGMLDPEDVASAVVFALTQPEKARAFLVGLRPMSEPL